MEKEFLVECCGVQTPAGTVERCLPVASSSREGLEIVVRSPVGSEIVVRSPGGLEIVVRSPGGLEIVVRSHGETLLNRENYLGSYVCVCEDRLCVCL